jgi:hypothetical protein
VVITSFVKSIKTFLVASHYIQQMGAIWRREIDLIGSHSGARLLFMRSEIIGRIIIIIITGRYLVLIII